MDKNVTIHRGTMRGLHKCPSCGHYNGNRAKGCRNAKCTLHYLKKGPDRNKPLIDAVQLVSYTDTKIFSVRVKDRDPTQRNFVQIVDITLTADQDGSIVSRNAICFVDTCKYDSTDLNISCKHVKSASESTKHASELRISHDVLYAMNISAGLKDSLWLQYSEHEQSIPAVQRINRSTFVVKCKASPSLAAGRLHATIAADDESDFNYSCDCRKLEIVLSPNNSVVLKNATCDHLILILAGLLSSDMMRRDYQKFMNSLESLWMTECFNFNGNLLKAQDLISFPENILNSYIEFSPDATATNQSIFNSESAMQSAEEEQIQFVNAPLTSANDIDETEFETANLELAECQIELMDQFKLTNQIDLCNDDIQLCEADLFAENHIICDMSNEPEQGIGSLEFCDDNGCDLVANLSPVEFGPEVMVVPQQVPKRKLPDSRINAAVENFDKPPSLEFNSWLNFVIERLNSAVDFNLDMPVVVQNFDVKHDFFAYFSRKFSVGDKRRIPNSTTIIKNGKFKGLVKSVWIFTTVSTVRRIFRTNESSIEFEHVFREKSPGCYVQYDAKTIVDDSTVSCGDRKLKRILPKLYKAFIQIGLKNKTSLGGFAIEWIPNVFPKNQFGVMRIQFGLGFKKNNKIIEKDQSVS